MNIASHVAGFIAQSYTLNLVSMSSQSSSSMSPGSSAEAAEYVMLYQFSLHCMCCCGHCLIVFTNENRCTVVMICTSMTLLASTW
jgi:hypothetical protein